MKFPAYKAVVLSGCLVRTYYTPFGSFPTESCYLDTLR